MTIIAVQNYPGLKMKANASHDFIVNAKALESEILDTAFSVGQSDHSQFLRLESLENRPLNK